jgi:hypothetical protein
VPLTGVQYVSVNIIEHYNLIYLVVSQRSLIVVCGDIRSEVEETVEHPEQKTTSKQTAVCRYVRLTRGLV